MITLDSNMINAMELSIIISFYQKRTTIFTTDEMVSLKIMVPIFEWVSGGSKKQAVL